MPEKNTPVNLNVRVHLSDLESGEVLSYAPSSGSTVVVPDSKPIINILLGTNDLFDPLNIKFRFRFSDKKDKWIYLDQEQKIKFFQYETRQLLH